MYFDFAEKSNIFVKITVGMYFKMHKGAFKFTQNYGESQHMHTKKLIVICI